MKKVLAIVLAAVMILSCSMTAFATVTVDNVTVDGSGTKTTSDGVKVICNEYNDGGYINVETSGGDPNIVSVSAPEEHLTVNGNISGGSGNASITAQTTSWENPTSTVIVKGNVQENGDKEAVYAYNHGVVYINGDVTEKEAGHAIHADGDSQVNVYNVKDQKGEVIRVTFVEESGAGNAINATDKSTVIVEGNVKENGEGHAIFADGNGTAVEVYEDVEASGEGYAILAENSQCH